MMKFLATGVILCLLTAGSARGMDIVAKGKANCKIRIDEASRDSEVVSFAASELRKYISRITGVTLEMTEEPGVPALELGLAAEARAAAAGFDGNDGYLVAAEGNVIKIRGRTERGVLYGVYALLEHFGCRWYDHEEKDQVVPEKKSLSFSGRIESSPDFQVRALQLRSRQVVSSQSEIRSLGVERLRRIVDWAAKTRYNWIEFRFRPEYDPVREDMRKRGMVAIIGTHTMDSLFWFSSAPLTKTRPELFAEVNGVRGKHPPYFRPCSTNSEAADLVAQKVIQFLREYPEMNVVGITPADSSGGWCECQECRKIQPRAQCPIRKIQVRTDQYWHFVNKVMERVWKEMPQVQIMVWACYNYQEPVRNPENLLPADKVWVVIDNFERCTTHDIDADACPTNQKRFALQRKWLELFPGRVFLWSYETGRFDLGQGYKSAWPAHRHIQRDFAIYDKYGLMGSITNWETSMAAPSNSYFTGRVMWDLDLDVDKLHQEFYEKYYGPVRDQMATFFKEPGEMPFGCPFDSGWGGVKHVAYGFDDPRIERLSDLLKQAVGAAKEEPYLSRVVEVKERFETLVAWVKLWRLTQEGEKILALPEAERKTEAQAKALQRLKDAALPYYLHLAACKDPAARMGQGFATGRKATLSRWWKSFGAEPPTE